jgi:hypothetical protein
MYNNITDDDDDDDDDNDNDNDNKKDSNTNEGGRDSAVGIVTGWTAKGSEFESR